MAADSATSLREHVDTPEPLDLEHARAQVAAAALTDAPVGRVGLEVEGHLVDLDRPLVRVPWARVVDTARRVPPLPGGSRLTVEPGGQLELSGAALSSAAACRAGLFAHVREVTDAARPLGVRFIAGGFRPFGSLEDVPWLPKRRYAVMRAYLPTRGRLGHEMMKRTATVQANLDYSDEAEAVEKMRTAFGVTSIVTALYAASPISEGRPN